MFKLLLLLLPTVPHRHKALRHPGGRFSLFVTSLLQSFAWWYPSFLQLAQRVGGFLGLAWAWGIFFRRAFSRSRFLVSMEAQASPRNPPTLCVNCKKEGYHQAKDCYELATNKEKHPPGWHSALWRWGTVGNKDSSNLNITTENSTNNLLANYSPNLTPKNKLLYKPPA